MTQHRPALSVRRLGAAAVVGGALAVSLTGVTAPSASAATTLTYTCNVPILNAKDFTVTLDTTAPASAAPGSVSVDTISGTVGLPADVSNAIRGILGYTAMEGTTPSTATVTGPGGSEAGTLSGELVTPRTSVTGSGNISLPISGRGGSFTAEAEGDYSIQAPASFTSTFTGYKADGSKDNPLTIPCTYKSGNKAIDTIAVGEEGPTPTPTGTSTTDPSPTGTDTGTGTPTETGTGTDTGTGTGSPTDTGTDTGTGTDTTSGPPVQTDYVGDKDSSNTTLALAGLATLGVVVGAGFVARRRTQD